MLMRARSATATVDARALKELRRIPGIGPSLARDLWDLGIRRVDDLRRRKPERLYERLCTLRGARQDPCVLYTFRCAVYYASGPDPDPELLKWWKWKNSAPESTAGRASANLSASTRLPA